MKKKCGVNKISIQVVTKTNSLSLTLWPSFLSHIGVSAVLQWKAHTPTLILYTYPHTHPSLVKGVNKLWHALNPAASFVNKVLFEQSHALYIVYGCLYYATMAELSNCRDKMAQKLKILLGWWNIPFSFFHKIKYTFFIFTNNFIDLDILNTSAISCYCLLVGRRQGCC